MADNVRKMLKIVGKEPTFPMKDSDGDGVSNISDCKPFDKNRQGFFHDKLKQFKEERAQSSAARRIIKKKAFAAGLRAEEKETIKTAEFKARQRGERRRKTIKGGGVVAQFASGFSPPRSRRAPVRRAARSRRPQKSKTLRAPRRRTTKRKAPSRSLDIGSVGSDIGKIKIF